MPASAIRRPRVLLADDHAVVIEGLRCILAPEFEIVGAVSDGRALIAAAERIQPDVIVTDISMPLLNGIEAVRQIRNSIPEVKVVFLTMHSDVRYASAALKAGGAAFVLKSSAGDELMTAIREVISGRDYVTSALSSEAVRALVDPGAQRKEATDALTSRQREVLQLVAEGKTLKEIGGVLQVSSRTVEFHKYRIMRALGLRTTGELTRYAVKHGIVDA